MNGNPPLISDFTFIDGYESSDLELQSSLKIINAFIKHSDKPLSINSEKLKNAYQVVEVALKQFKSRSEIEYSFIIETCQLLTTHKVGLCHQTTKENYNRVVNLFVATEEMKGAFRIIEKFLTMDPDSQPLDVKVVEQALIMSNLAIIFFDRLPTSRIPYLKHTYSIVKVDPLPSITEHEENKKLYDKILTAFKKLDLFFILRDPKLAGLYEQQVGPITLVTENHPIKETSVVNVKSNVKFLDNIFKSDEKIEKEKEIEKKRKEEEEKIAKGVFVVCHSHLSEEEKILLKKKLEEQEDLKKCQVVKICALLRQLIETYFPIYMKLEPHSELNGVLKLFLSDFDKFSTSFVSRFFFKEPRKLAKLEQELLISVTHNIALFLEDIKECGFIHSNPLAIASMYTKLQKRIVPSFHQKPGEINEKDTQELMYTYLREIFKLILKDKEAEELKYETGSDAGSSFGALIGTCILEQLMKPETLFFLTDRILDEHRDFNTLENNSLPLGIFDCDDDITSSLSHILERLGIVLVGFGDPGGMMQLITKALMVFLSKKKEPISEKIQQFIARTRSNQCSMLPLLVLSHLIIRQSNGQVIPILNELTVPKENQAVLKKQLISRLSKMIVKVLNEELTKITISGGWMVSKMGSIENFCTTLISNTWQTLENKSLSKILSLYILIGVHKACTKVLS